MEPPSQTRAAAVPRSVRKQTEDIAGSYTTICSATARTEANTMGLDALTPTVGSISSASELLTHKHTIAAAQHSVSDRLMGNGIEEVCIHTVVLLIIQPLFRK